MNEQTIRVHPSFPRYAEFDPQVPVWCLTPSLRGCFHRFFDTSAISPSGRYLAALQMPREDRMPEVGEPANVVLVDLLTAETKIVAPTCGWESQLGANINWGVDDHHLIFSDVDTQSWTPQLVRLDPLTGKAERTPGGVYHVSPDGKYACCTSPAKMRRTQYGYGVLIPDDRVPTNHGAPDDDGLFITDLSTGARKLVLSLRRALNYIPDFASGKHAEKDWQIYGFHSKWSPDGSRLIFTVRRAPEATAVEWNNIHHALRYDVLTCKPDGSDVHDAVPADRWEHGGHHINWFPDSQRLSMNLGGFAERLRLVSVNYDGSDLKPVFADVLGTGHPTVHECGHILTDTYVSEWPHYDDTTVPLRWIDMRSGEERTIVRIESQVKPQPISALRVDAHPAWDRSRRYVVFNGVSDNTRRVYLADMRSLLG